MIDRNEQRHKLGSTSGLMEYLYKTPRKSKQKETLTLEFLPPSEAHPTLTQTQAQDQVAFASPQIHA